MTAQQDPLHSLAQLDNMALVESIQEVQIELCALFASASTPEEGQQAIYDELKERMAPIPAVASLSEWDDTPSNLGYLLTKLVNARNPGTFEGRRVTDEEVSAFNFGIEFAFLTLIKALSSQEPEPAITSGNEANDSASQGCRTVKVRPNPPIIPHS